MTIFHQRGNVLIGASCLPQFNLSCYYLPLNENIARDLSQFEIQCSKQSQIWPYIT